MTPYGNSHLKNTAGSTFTAQRQGGTLVGLNTATSIITKAISIKGINSLDNTIYTTPKELSGAKVYNTQKILSSGTFAYNAAKNKTWVISTFTTTLAGVANTFLKYMSTITTGKTFPYYNARNYIDNTSLVRKGSFSRTGYDVSGVKIKKRTTWETNPSATAGADFGTSTQVPTRAVPGEFFILNNLVNYTVSTSSNYFDYRPITGK